MFVAAGADVLSQGIVLTSLDDACRRAAAYADPIQQIERVALIDAMDRILAEDVRATVALPPFD